MGTNVRLDPEQSAIRTRVVSFVTPQTRRMASQRCGSGVITPSKVIVSSKWKWMS